MSSDEDNSISFDTSALSVIAKPLATPKVTKRLFKLVRKSAKDKSLKRGVKEVVKAIRKNAKGYPILYVVVLYRPSSIVIMAGDISPIDVLSHVPVLCEESNISYVFVPSKTDLGAAGNTRRPTCCVMVSTPKADADSRKTFDKCIKEVAGL